MAVPGDLISQPEHGQMAGEEGEDLAGSHGGGEVNARMARITGDDVDPPQIDNTTFCPAFPWNRERKFFP